MQSVLFGESTRTARGEGVSDAAAETSDPEMSDPKTSAAETAGVPVEGDR